MADDIGRINRSKVGDPYAPPDLDVPPPVAGDPALQRLAGAAHAPGANPAQGAGPDGCEIEFDPHSRLEIFREIQELVSQPPKELVEFAPPHPGKKEIFNEFNLELVECAPPHNHELVEFAPPHLPELHKHELVEFAPPHLPELHKHELVEFAPPHLPELHKHELVEFAPPHLPELHKHELVEFAPPHLPELHKHELHKHELHKHELVEFAPPHLPHEIVPKPPVKPPHHDDGHKPKPI